MRIRHVLPVTLSLVTTFVLADVDFTLPAAGSSTPAGQTITITWQDSNTGTPLSSLSTYQLFLMAGGNDDSSMMPVATVTSSGQFSQAASAAFTIQPGLGGSDKNAYFLKIISASTSGATVTNYSPRFTLSGMTGQFPANVEAGIKAADGSTDGPPTETSGANSAAMGPDAYTVPYNLQTGPTRYAPMQPVPPTKITVNAYSPLFPTSAVTYAKTFLPTPEAVTTVTVSQTFSVSSMENPASAAPMPSNDMQKFLARWKD